MSFSASDVQKTTVRPLTFNIMAIMFAVTSVLLVLISARLSARGTWLPDPPIEIGQWTGSENPLGRAALQQLGGAKTIGFSYANLLTEQIDAHIISTSNFDSYLDPRVLMSRLQYTMTAQKELSLFGKDGTVRALVFRHPELGETRILMYYWIQYQDGKTVANDTLQQGEDLIPRLRLGTAAALQGAENCVVRVVTRISPGDPEGRQARRNIEEVCLAIHDTFKAKGRKGGDR